ncbi:hypothetical protein ACFX13_003310 [Malus domestica]
MDCYTLCAVQLCVGSFSYAKERRLTTMIQVVQMDYIRTAFERLEKNNVRYRFVVDVAGSRKNHIANKVEIKDNGLTIQHAAQQHGYSEPLHGGKN